MWFPPRPKCEPTTTPATPAGITHNANMRAPTAIPMPSGVRIHRLNPVRSRTTGCTVVGVSAVGEAASAADSTGGSSGVLIRLLPQLGGPQLDQRQYRQ